MRAVNFPGMRNINRSIVLNIIRDHGPISRGEIARRSQLAPSAVSNIVTELISLGLVRDSHLAKPEGGRPATMVQLNADSAYVIGVNVGLTSITTVVTNLVGTIVGRAIASTRFKAPAEVLLEQVAQSAREAASDAGIRFDQLVGLGIGIPGLVDTEAGVSVFSPNLGWRGVPVKAILESLLECPVYVDNDVRAATLGEREYGAGDQARYLVAVFVGSAIGSGLVLDGRLYYGAGDGAGEIGHIQVVEDGPLCRCGNRGCLESVASGRAIAAKAQRLLMDNAPFTYLKSMADPRQVTAKDVSKAAQLGDQLAAVLMSEAARHIGRAVSFLVNTYNPEKVVISGGVSKAGDQILGPIREVVQQQAMPIARDAVRIVPGKLGSQAGPLGAAGLVMKRIFPSIRLAQSHLIAKESL